MTTTTTTMMGADDDTLEVWNAGDDPASIPPREADTAIPLARREGREFSGLVPESWLCIDCGFNTGPGLLNRREMEKAVAALGDGWDIGASVEQHVNDRSEVYNIRPAVWKKTGMGEWGGCLCIGCLERRLGRKLKPKDFLRGDPLNDLPGTPRLLQRRGG